jgi:hypothetical protein
VIEVKNPKGTSSKESSCIDGEIESPFDDLDGRKTK